MPTGLPPETRRQRAARINRQLALDHESDRLEREERGNVNGTFAWGSFAIVVFIGWILFFVALRLIG